MKNRAFTIIMSLLLVTMGGVCNLLPQAVAESSQKVINLPSYSINYPPGKKWELTIDEYEEKVQFEKESKSFLSPDLAKVTILNVLKNGITDEMEDMSIEEIAKDFLDGEEKIMRVKGEANGQYKIKKLEKSTMQINGKKLYTMYWKISAGDGFKGVQTSESTIFLYFPTEFHKNHLFFIFLIADAYPGMAFKHDPKAAHEVIKSFQAKETKKQIEKKPEVVETLEVKLTRAKYCVDIGRFKEAKGIYLGIIKENSSHKEANARLADIYYFTQDYESAIEIYYKLIEWYPDFNKPRHRLGQIYMDSNEYEKSVSELKQLVSEESNNSGFYNDLATAYALNGDLDNAEECYKKALLLNPNNSLAASNLGYTFYKKGMWRDAIDYYLLARNLYFLTGGNEEKLKVALKESKSNFKKLSKKNTEDPSPHYYLAYAWAFKGKWKKAHAEIGRAIELNPNNSEFYEAKGLFLTSQGKYKEAIEPFSSCIESDPKNWICYMSLGEIYTNLRKLPESLSWFEKADALNPSVFPIKNNMGVVYFKSGKYEEALSCFEDAEAIKPDDPRVNLHLAVINYELKNYDLAWKYALRMKSWGYDETKNIISDLQRVSKEPY